MTHVADASDRPEKRARGWGGVAQVATARSIMEDRLRPRSLARSE
jgi:hypothetical protein